MSCDHNCETCPSRSTCSTNNPQPSSCNHNCETCPSRASCPSNNPQPSTCDHNCSTCPSRGQCPSSTQPQQECTHNCATCPSRGKCSSSGAPDVQMDEIVEKLKQIPHKYIILSGKGGVGKSTFATQFSWVLSEDKFVGLCDLDICGPSIPQMFGQIGMNVLSGVSGLQPVFVTENLCTMSIDYIAQGNNALIWRGPMKNGLIRQFIHDVDWGNLDYLIFDTPPGTSDEHLTIVNILTKSGVDGAIIVTTPQDVALLDVRKEINFCKRIGLPIIGVVENMSGFVCPCCHKESIIFPATDGGAEKMCKDMDVKFLGKIPLDPMIAKSCDIGSPYFIENPSSEATKYFTSVYKQVIDKI